MRKKLSHSNWMAFRVDGSTGIGTGHVMRCLTLANLVHQHGVSCVFASRNLTPSLALLVEKSDHTCLLLNQNGPAPSAEQGEYGRWLGTTEHFDSQAFLVSLRSTRSKFGEPLTVLVDHYGLGESWEAEVHRQTGAPISVIDDLDRLHDCAILVDATYGKSEVNYSGRVPDEAMLLVGSQYALLRPDFARMRDEALQRRNDRAAEEAPVANLLVTMGGGDQHNWSAWAASAIRPLAQEFGFHVHLLLGAAYPHEESLRELSVLYGEQMSIHRSVSEIAELLLRIDVCIGSAGSSTWERCCLGLPTINLILAENQRQICEELSSIGAAANGGDFTVQTNVPQPYEWANTHLRPLLESVKLRDLMTQAACKVTDGNGASRVLGHLLALRVPGGSNIPRDTD
jgi:UDP-2,4-diacetamido-2,4,6-trideoxy-beta-L-altropyranose hydrolase